MLHQYTLSVFVKGLALGGYACRNHSSRSEEGYTLRAFQKMLKRIIKSSFTGWVWGLALISTTHISEANMSSQIKNSGSSDLEIAQAGTEWASYQIRKIAGCACAGNAGNVFPRRRFQRKLLVSDPGMHHGTCVTHVPWCMSGSLTCGDGENVPGIPGACTPAILRIWQEAHGSILSGFLVLVQFWPSVS